MKRYTLVLVLALLVKTASAQIPRIDGVERIITYPFAEVEIKGSGFSNTPAQLDVWFGSVKGEIVSSTESNIRVKVPAQARLTQVEVIHKGSRRSGKSSLKHMLNFSGKQPFINSFEAKTYSTNPDDVFDICSCDFDGDGRPDIVGSKFKDGKSNLVLLTNTSTIQVSSTTLAFNQSSVSISVPTFSLTCGDLNGDGKPDLVVTRGGTITGNTVYVFPNTSNLGAVSFGSPVTLDLAIGDFAKEVAVHDLNGDGRPEIIVTNGATNNLYIFENQLTSTTISNTQFSRRDISVGVATLALEIADVTGDGWPDIVTAPNSNAQRVIVLRNPGNGSLTFAAPTNVTVGGSNNINDIAVADFNNDGLLDFVVADRGSNKAFVYLNRTNLLFQSVNGTTGYASPTAWGVDVGDMNGDGYADFVIGNRDFGDPQVNVYISNAAATPSFTGTKIVTLKANWFVRVGDFDGDAKPDIAVTSTNNSTSFSIDVIRNRNCHQPIILNENPLTICNGQTIELQTIPMRGVAFTWSTGDTGYTANIGYANTGTITLNAVGEGGACSTSTTLTVNAGAGSAPVKPSITGLGGVCAGSALILNTNPVAGSPTFQWRGPNGYSVDNTTNSVTVRASATAADAGSYTVRVKVGDCFSDVSDPYTVTVVEPAGFSITASSGNSGVCSGQPVTLSVNPVSGYNYQWKKGSTNLAGQTNPSLTIASAAAADAGTYSVLISHQTISCSSETSPFTLAVYNAPVASFTTSPAQICVGTEVSFNASGSTVANNVTANYAWDFGDNATGTGATSTHTYGFAASTITARLTISYAGISGCTNFTSRSFAVNEAIAPEIFADPDVLEICSNQTESVILAVDGDFTSYQWNVPSNNTGSSITVRAPGRYTVTTTDANGCTGNAELTLVSKADCETVGANELNVSAPKVFTPNDDQANDFWLIEGIEEYPDCTLSIFDGKGMRVYEAQGSVLAGNPWNGRGTNGPVPDGTYYYVIGCPDGGKKTGSVLIVR